MADHYSGFGGSLGEKWVCEVTISTSPPKKSPAKMWDTWDPQFASFDATLTNYNGENWPERVQKNLVKYVEGGDFVVVHAANNAFPGWTKYNRMIGLGGWGGERKSPAHIFILTIKENWFVTLTRAWWKSWSTKRVHGRTSRRFSSHHGWNAEEVAPCKRRTL